MINTRTPFTLLTSVGLALAAVAASAQTPPTVVVKPAPVASVSAPLASTARPTLAPPAVSTQRSAVPQPVPPVTSSPEARTGPTEPQASGVSASELLAGDANGAAVLAAFRADWAVGSGLTSAEVARRAAANSVAAEARRAEVGAAEAAVDKTLYGSLPRLTLTGSYTRLSPITLPSFGPSGQGSLVATNEAPGLLSQDAQFIGIDASLFSFPVILNQYAFNANLVVPISSYLLTTARAIRGAEAYHAGKVYEEKATRLTAAANARLAYYAWVRATLQTVVARQMKTQAEQRLVWLQRMVQAGRAAGADVHQSRAVLANAELAERQAETAVAITERRLRTSIGAKPEEKLVIGEDVLAPFEQATEGAAVEALFREATQKRLELKALDRSSYSLEEGAAVQRAGVLPSLEAVGNFTVANPNQRIIPQSEEWTPTWDVGIRAVWTMNDWGTRSAEAASTLAQAKQVKAQRRELIDGLHIEILTSRRALQDARLSQRTAVEGWTAADAAYRSRLILYRGGRSTHLELVQAETSRFQAQLSLIEAHVALREARVRLDHAVGRDAGQLQ